MGYALFAQRKLALTSMLNVYQVQLEDIQEQKMNLLNYSAATADGYITADEWADNPQLFNQFNSFELAFQNSIAVHNEDGTVATTEDGKPITQVVQYVNNVIKPDVSQYEAYCNQVEASYRSNYATNVESKRIANEETKLDMQMKKLETKISAIQNEIQSVEQAEARAIQNSTPKYGGLG